jgi:antitoxin VapB
VALHIEDPQAERLARELAEITGEPLAEAVTVALRARIAAVRRLNQIVSGVERIQAVVRALPVLDSRSADEILGYDEYGLPR